MMLLSAIGPPESRYAPSVSQSQLCVWTVGASYRLGLSLFAA